jgi:hypothetical protein
MMTCEYQGKAARSHIALLPKSWESSLFFAPTQAFKHKSNFTANIIHDSNSTTSLKENASSIQNHLIMIQGSSLIFQFDCFPDDGPIATVSDEDSLSMNDDTTHDPCHHDSTTSLNLRHISEDDVQGGGGDAEDDDEVRRLPSDYAPSDADVVCARGKAYWDHTGNRRYRQLIGKATEKYSSSSNKLEKTLIVSEIVNAVHRLKGKFIKKEKKGGPWVEVDEVFAREKVGQSLRDGLSTKYRSATKAKKKRRNEANEKLNGDIDRVIQSNHTISRRIEELIQQVKMTGDLASDYSIMALFNRANSDILETIKSDASMLFQFQDASVGVNGWGRILD